MVCNSIGGVYGIEIAPVLGAFAPFAFSPNSPALLDSIKEDERGIYREIDFSFSFVPGQYPAQYAALFDLAASFIKLKLIDIKGAVFNIGSDNEGLTLLFSETKGADSSITVNIKGFLLCA